MQSNIRTKPTRIPEKNADRQRVAQAILELLSNKATPEDLTDKLTEFICEAGNGSIAKRYTELPGGLAALEHLLSFVEWKEATNDGDN